jgi:hypothetical protein
MVVARASLRATLFQTSSTDGSCGSRTALPSICDCVGRATESGLVASIARLVQCWCNGLGPDMRTPPTNWIGGVVFG